MLRGVHNKKQAHSNYPRTRHFVNIWLSRGVLNVQHAAGHDFGRCLLLLLLIIFPCSKPVSRQMGLLSRSAGRKEGGRAGRRSAQVGEQLGRSTRCVGARQQRAPGQAPQLSRSITFGAITPRAPRNMELCLKQLETAETWSHAGAVKSARFPFMLLQNRMRNFFFFLSPPSTAPHPSFLLSANMQN